MRRVFSFGLSSLVLVSLAGSSLCAGSATNPFGFTGPEIFPIDSLIAHLSAADIDGDGLNDLIVANNSKSKITILYNQTGKTNAPSAPKLIRRDLNDLPADARFRVESIAAEKRITSMVVADLNGDGRPDIATFGEPRELTVQYNQGNGVWSAPKRWPIEDGQLAAQALISGDLNGDGRADLLLLGEHDLYFFAQREDHTLAEPDKMPFSGALKSAQIVDIDADGRNDLLLVNWEDRNPFRFRLQRSKGQLGPETYFSPPPIRAYWADILEPGGKTQIISIALNSGRAQISEFTRKPAEPLAGSLVRGQFQLLPLDRTEKARRGLTWADLNGDGLPDLLIAEPESGQISIALQQPDGTLSEERSFPSLAGVSDLAVADWDGDGKPELFLLSADERQIGVARLDDKLRLPFPTLIPVEGRPLAFAVGTLKPQDPPVLAIIYADASDRRVLLLRWADGKTSTQKLAESFRGNPTTLAFHDANQDGLMDLVALTPYEKVKVLLQSPGKDFEEVDVAPPGGGDRLEQPWLSVADIDGDGKAELLLAQKNFLRAVVLSPETARAGSTNQSGWAFRVKEQINGAGSNSRLVGAAAVPNGTNAIPILLMLDAERKVLTVCERDATGVWQVARNLPLPISDFNALQPIKVGGASAVAFLGLNAAGWMAFGGEVWELNELDGYETPIKDARLNEVVTGDLNNDGRKDLVFLETEKNHIDVVSFNSDHKLMPGNRWQVFEERTFRSRRSDLPEPREAVIADVTGDRKNDLIVLVHDRILVYPQE